MYKYGVIIATQEYKFGVRFGPSGIPADSSAPYTDSEGVVWDSFTEFLKTMLIDAIDNGSATIESVAIADVQGHN